MKYGTHKIPVMLRSIISLWQKKYGLRVLPTGRNGNTFANTYARTVVDNPRITGLLEEPTL